VTYFGAVAIVIASAAVAGVASLVVSRAAPFELRRSFHPVGAQVFLQLGVMFAVLLAFVFSEVWGEYNTAAQAIDGECSALHSASMLARTFPSHAGRPLNRAIVIYAATVIDKEWPLMAKRQHSLEASHDFRRILEAAAGLDPSQPGEISVHSRILALLSDAHAQRETRLLQVGLGLPGAMWTVLILLSLSLIGLVLFAAIDRPAHVVLAGGFAACLVMVLLLVAMIDFPFEGSLALGKDDFVKLQSEVSALVAEP
jgi:hypothetical protein